MRHLAFFMVSLFFITVDICSAQPTIIQPEIPTAVQLSNRDINRLVCPAKMNDLIFSQEKGMTGHFSGNNGFIKFTIEKIGNEFVFAEGQSELFVVCDGAVYTLIVTPTDIPSVTLHLAAPASKSFEKNITHHKNLPLEKKVLQLIQEAYAESYPTSYRVTHPGKTISLTSDLEIQLLQAVDVEGVGLRLKNYLVTSRDVKQKRIDEKLFLSSKIGTSILAVSLENHVLEPNRSTRLFVVEQKELSQ